MVKLTIILIVISILFKGVANLYFNSLNVLDKFRISSKVYTKLENIIFFIFGLTHIIMWICIAISLVMIAFKYL